MSAEIRYGPTAQEMLNNPLMVAANERSELASATGLAALVESWKARLNKIRSEQRRYEQMGWHMQGHGTDLKLQGNELEKCIQELEAANDPSSATRLGDNQKPK